MRISCANTHFLNNAFNFCAGGQRSLCIQRIQSIENEAAVGARQTVQNEGIPILLKNLHTFVFSQPQRRPKASNVKAVPSLPN